MVVSIWYTYHLFQKEGQCIKICTSEKSIARAPAACSTCPSHCRHARHWQPLPKEGHTLPVAEAGAASVTSKAHADVAERRVVDFGDSGGEEEEAERHNARVTRGSVGSGGCLVHPLPTLWLVCLSKYNDIQINIVHRSCQNPEESLLTISTNLFYETSSICNMMPNIVIYYAHDMQACSLAKKGI